MRFPWWIKSTAKLVTITLMTAGLIISVRSDAKIEASQHSLAYAGVEKEQCSAQYCFAPIDYGNTTGGLYCTQVTGINNFSNIIGTYQNYSSSSGCHGDYSGFEATSPSYKPTGITSDCTCSLLMEGLDDGHSDFTNTIKVGYWVQPPASTGCTSGGCGFFLLNGTWTAISDPNEGSSPCHVTRVLAISNVGQGVGYYETGSSKPCGQQAFEYYPGNGTGGGSSSNSDIVYADLNPPPPSSSSGQASTQATGINQLGDIVGTMSWQVGSATRTIGWMYSDLNYYDLCFMTASCGTTTGQSYNTFPEGIDFEDRVVGYYTNGAGTWGFITLNPEAGKQWSKINDTKYVNNYTIVRGITPDKVGITGWTEDANGELHGFVGTCQGTGC